MMTEGQGWFLLALLCLVNVGLHVIASHLYDIVKAIRKEIGDE